MTVGERPSMFSHPRFGWEFFGSELKRRREAETLTQQQLGERVFCSGSYIGQFEQAIRKPQLDVSERIDAELGTDGFFARMCMQLIASSPYDEYFREALYLEGLAASIREYESVYVPGLLQTPAYNRAVVLAENPVLREEKVVEYVRIRQERSAIFERPEEPTYWAVLDESAIRRPTGSSQVMREQLLHIAQLAQRRRICVQVLPFAAGGTPLAGTVKLMTFKDAPPVTYFEAHVGMLLDHPSAVSETFRRYDVAVAVALPPQESLALIESVAEEYANDSRVGT
jgi:transcriptional regulator with XRE-family HTH domain